MIKQFSAAILLAATAVAASAADTQGFYLGADFGQTKVDSMNNDTSVGAFAGYQFNQYVALEAGYRNMGKYEFVTSYWDHYTRRSYYASFDVGMKQTSVSLILAAPLGSRFSVYSRLGYNKLSADVSGYSRSQSGTLAGIGMGFAFTQNVAARIEYQRPASDVQNLSAGVSYKF